MKFIRPRAFFRRVVPDMGALLLLLVLVAFFFWRLWAPNSDDRLRFPSGDFTEQYYPLRHFVAASFAEGRLPFWNPYIFGGQPGLADPQAAVLYPPSVLNALLWGADFPLEALEFEAVAHIALAACGTYFFVRLALQLGIIPGLVAAVIFAFGGYLTGFPIQQITILETLAWLPWLLLTLHYAAPPLQKKIHSNQNDKKRLPPRACLPAPTPPPPAPPPMRRTQAEGVLGEALKGGAVFGMWSGRQLISSALASCVLGSALLAGHPQSAVYLAYLSGSYALLLFVGRGIQLQGFDSPSKFRDWLVSAVPLFAVFVLGVGLAAAQLLPTFEYIDEATREDPEYNFVQNGLMWLELTEILWPKLVGSTPLYIGILPLLLAPLGLISAGQRTQKRFWGAAALIALLLALGGNSVLFDLLYLGVPYLENVRNQERVLIIWNWSLSLLAAWGAATLLTMLAEEHERARLRGYVSWVAKFIPVFLLPLIVLWWLQALKFAQLEVNLKIVAAFFERYSFVFVMFLLSWGLLAWHSYSSSSSQDRAKPRRNWHTVRFSLLLLSLLVFDLFSMTRSPHLGERADEPFMPRHEVIDALLALQEEVPAKVAVVGEPSPNGNDGMYWQIPLLSGNEPLRIHKSQKFFEQANSWRQFQLLGVRYVVADRDLASEAPAAFELLATSSSGGDYLLHIRPSMPYVWIVGQAQVRSNRHSLFHRLNLDTFDPYVMAFVEDEIPPLAPEGASADVTLLEHDIGFAQVRVQNPAAGPVLLIFAEPAIRGWQLLLDGEPVKSIRANAINVSTFVPPGEHLVTLRYEQPGWQEGVRISAVSLVVVLLMLVAGTWKIRSSSRV